MPPRTGGSKAKAAASPAKGKGSAKGAAKRHKKTFRNEIKGISKPALRRLARRAGVKRISAAVYEDARSVVRSFIESVVYYSLLYRETYGRRTVSLKDVVNALKRRGAVLVGAEQLQSKKKSGKGKKSTKK